LKLADLHLDPLNANKGTKRGQKAIVSSLERYGAGRSILLDRNGTIIAGNHVVQNAAVAGLADEVIIVPSDGTRIIAVQRTDLDLNDPKARELAIADNRSSELGLEWNPEVLGQLVTDLDLKPFFTDSELADLLPKTETELSGDEDEVPDAPAEPITKTGDIYILGDHRLLCGDSTDLNQVERLMQTERAALVFTDPPYGVDYEGINNDSRLGLESLLDDSIGNASVVSERGAACYVFHSDRCADIFHTVFRKWCHFSSMVVWVKPSLVMGRSDYHSRHEPCLYGWFNTGTHKWFGDRSQDSVWEFGRDDVKGHTTPKPVALIEKAIQNSSQSGHIVLDLFGGSGSTLIACEKTGRKARLIELDPRYCDVIVARWEAATGKKAELINART
jgi:DNA modification methylase